MKLSRGWPFRYVLQVSAGLWTQCVSTLNETQQKAIQDLLNTAWACNPGHLPALSKKPMKKSWAPGSPYTPSSSPALICSVYGRRLHPLFFPSPSLTPPYYNTTSDSTFSRLEGAGWIFTTMEDIGHPPQRLSPCIEGSRPCLIAVTCLLSGRFCFQPFPDVCLEGLHSPRRPTQTHWTVRLRGAIMGTGHYSGLSSWMKWKCTQGNHCLSPVNLFSFLYFLFYFFSCSVFPVLPGGRRPLSATAQRVMFPQVTACLLSG